MPKGIYTRTKEMNTGKNPNSIKALTHRFEKGNKYGIKFWIGNKIGIGNTHGFQKGKKNKNWNGFKKGYISFRKGISQIEEYGIEKAKELKSKNRIAMINRLLKNGGQARFGKNETKILDLFEKNINYKILRQYPTKNGFLDGYIPELNIAIEIDEKSHFYNGKLKQKDIDRQIRIENELNCSFIRIADV